MNRLETAAAFWGSAENPHYTIEDRLKLALAALARYEQTVEEIRGWCDQQDESPTTGAVRSILEKEDGP